MFGLSNKKSKVVINKEISNLDEDLLKNLGLSSDEIEYNTNFFKKEEDRIKNDINYFDIKS